MPKFLFRRAIAFALFLSLVSLSAGQTTPAAPPPAPKAAAKPASKASPVRFTAIDDLMKKAVEEKVPPGALVIVGHNGRIVYRKAFGYRSLEPAREPMTLDTIFDMASLTKCLATATSIMRMVQLGQLRLNDQVSKYIPEFAQNGKADITVRQLLTHFSGLREDLDLKEPWTGYDTALQMAMAETPIYPPGSRFLYSDINYIVLGELVRRVAAMPLDKYASAHIFQPLKMTRTTFNPPASWRRKIASTSYDENHVMLRGVVHDPTARRMGGVAGHAGLFSTADDVARYAQALLNGGAPVLTRLSVEKMTTPEQPPTATSVRGIGWDIDSPFASNRGDFLPVGSFGHTGFTGTSLWIDPVTNTYIVLLTNAVHPNEGGSVVSLRARLANAVASALNLTVSEKDQLRLARITGYNDSFAAARRVPFRNGQVKTGLDVLVEHNFDVLQGKHRIGLVTNHTGIDAQGRRTIDVLARAPGVELAAIFSPEHGIAGTFDTTNISNSKDEATGVPIYSVYGATDESRRPSLEVLKTLDAVVYDIQDAGVRFYTYETTLGYLLEAAAKAGIEVIVLDRPNPITGAYVQGPVSDSGPKSPEEEFVDYHPEPIRHGMTIGELAKMFNAERGINAKLTVVPMEGWIRGDWYDSTGLLWINPSPNLRTVTEAALYPGVGLIEGTNISVGRGTDIPFEVVGAPWVKPKELADYLNARGIQGVRFVPMWFKPSASKYANQLCGGINLVLLERNFFDAPQLGFEIAAALHKLYPQDYKLDQLPKLLGNKAMFDALVAGEDPRRIYDEGRDALQKFMEVRNKYLLY